MRRIIELVEPDEVYNLAAQSHVRVSFDQPEYTADVVGVGALRLLEAVRDYVQRTGKQVRVYQAGSSEMFGAAAPPQSEATPFHPRSPYAVGKVAAHWFLDARRDWGFVGDYVDGMWRMLQEDAPDDYVLATSEAHSVREFVEAAFGRAELDWREHVTIDARYYRPAEVDYLLGDASKARRQLGWTSSVTFADLVEMMVDHDLARAERESLMREVGQALGGGGDPHAVR